MTANSHQDHWLLPTRQSDYAGLDPLAETVLHARREGSFLALAALAFTATLIVPVAAGWIDIAAALRVHVPFASVVPVGVLVMPIAIAVSLLVAELFGRRRSLAFALALSASALAIAAVIGLTTQVIALASYVIAVHLAGVLVFDVFRLAHGRLFWLRSLIAMLFAQLVGWAAFGGVLIFLGIDQDATVNVATAGIIYAGAGAFVLVVPTTIVKSLAGRYLRVGSVMPARVRRAVVESPERVVPAVVERVPQRVRERDPQRSLSSRFARASVYPTPVPAPIVRPITQPVVTAVKPTQPVVAVKPITQPVEMDEPFSSEEMKFFSDGDELSDRA